LELKGEDMDPTVTDTICTVISLAASVASLALAVLAIWIALYGKREAERTNQKTQDLLTEVRSDAKLIAQYAVPELKAYGDSVRRFVFQKGDTDSESSSVLSKVESVLAENMKRIRGEIDSIRDEQDMTAVRRKLNDLEAQLRSSQESVRKSVEDSKRSSLRVHDTIQGGTWVIPAKAWSWFLDHLDRKTPNKLAQYGERWVFVEPTTEEQVPEKLVKERRPLSDWGIGPIKELNLVGLS